MTEARRANTAVYFLDVRGLVAAPSGMQADVGDAPRPRRPQHGRRVERDPRAQRGQRGAGPRHRAASWSRNQQRPRPRASPGSGASRAATTCVGYSPTNRAADGRFRKIEVKVARAGRDRPRPARLLRPGAGRQEAAGRGARRRDPDAPSTRPSTCRTCPCGRSPTSSAKRPRGRRSVLLTAEADIRGLAFAEREGTARDTLEASPPRRAPGHRRVHPVRPAVRDGLPPGDARALRARPGSRSRAS